MLDAFSRLLEKGRERIRIEAEPPATWRESANVCALADAERHLGHAIRAGNFWIAYDAMHLHPTGNGFRVIGTFATIGAAKQAIQENAGFSGGWAAASVTVERAF
jgi:hypothetical protein